MTHESFKQILTWCDGFTTQQVNQFLDDLLESDVLDGFFTLWTQGKQRELFDLINSMNETLENTARNETDDIPIDANMPRTQQNENSI